ncbi:hypothetical protein [Mycobacterium sp. 3519A]|jgi:hypothetical protein|nr:hypothetical protein [Mycobacterium sp. 3519A]
MPRGKGIYDEEKTVEETGTTSDTGDADTTDENTPDVADTDQEPTG